MIRFQFQSGIYSLFVQQELSISVEEAWAFFSNPANLAKITPKNMGFEITSDKSKSMYPGQIITYKVGIFPLVKSNWVSEITHVENKRCFVDEQRFGPYAMWHHEHYFTPTESGILMQDKVSYKIPFGIVGRFTHWLFIKNQLRNIFRHRFLVLNKQFSRYTDEAA